MAEDRHVRFDHGSDKVSKNNSIIVQSAGNDKLHVHLGFLKYLHIYELTFSLNISQHLSHDDNETWTSDDSIVNPFCRITSLTLTDQEIVVVMEFKATKIKLLKENLQLLNGSGKTISLVFLARVLGKEQGTPMLKDGIHCTGLLPDEEAEATDWQGFD